MRCFNASAPRSPRLQRHPRLHPHQCLYQLDWRARRRLDRPTHHRLFWSERSTPLRHASVSSIATSFLLLWPGLLGSRWRLRHQAICDQFTL